ncbi:TraR/DksA family transcriptional regulator [Albimonas sp. CAU 1670]|uniref:TraR/DksA family transcriptional regulator n=1 Tax=Albimonas sp. CAU 1670 TaxID=3032599 RepID=UPI0023DC328B|nr:TraR/DksA family transcriptional regulator [Albimonas sp. CAU 1670]MDF2234931.1 TraR/DksA family transcriptional regulator [Albimonas sp. CAU 1670]
MIHVPHFKSVLETRLAELEARLHKIETDLDATPNADFEDRATERGNDEVLEGLGANGLAEIRLIRAALDRVDLGTYGECIECGEEIDEKRLELVPHAPLCTACASKA